MVNETSIVTIGIDFSNLGMSCFLLRKIADKIEDIVNLVDATENEAVPCVMQELQKKFIADLESEKCPVLRL